MKELNNIEGVYFLGIGGIGMSALARYFLAGGYTVAGYDRTPSQITTSLAEAGCHITYNDDITELPALFDEPLQRDKVVVVLTPAIPKESIMLNFFKEKGYLIYKRSEILGFISEETDAIAIAGTHGKTTVSTMTAHLLTVSALGCSAFLGGISRNYNTNLLIGEGNLAVMEADEFDRSFLKLRPLIAVVTAIDPDHLDIYGTPAAMIEAYSEFCHKVRKGGTLIINEKILSSLSLPEGVNVLTYGQGEGASFRASNIRRGEEYYVFDIITHQGIIHDIRLLMPGMVNILNATAAAAAALTAGATYAEIRNGLLLYKGVQRRFDIRFSSPGLTYIDDYAHHPEEINALVAAVRDFYPGKKITGFFQPHLYSRTRDFADGFAGALDKLDAVYLLNLYPAREKPIPGVSSEMIAALMKNKNVKVITKDKVLETVGTVTEGIVLTIGAGDIDRFVDPISQFLKERKR